MPSGASLRPTADVPRADRTTSPASSRKRVLLLQAISRYQNNFVPLGLAYIAATCEGNGCEVRIIDASAPYADYTIADLVKEVEAFGPDLLGFSLTTAYVNYSYDLMRLAAKVCPALIVAGGPHATVLPHEALRSGAHVVVRGEGEHTCLDIVGHLRGQMDLSEIAGISYLSPEGRIVDNPPRPLIDDLDSIRFPARHLFRRADFVATPADSIRYSTVITSRGCPGSCTYCASQATWGRRVRWRSAQNVVAEIRSLTGQYGLQKFTFYDDCFTANRKRTQELCRKLVEGAPGIQWNCITRVDMVDRDLLKTMKEAGCSHINFGIESGDPETLTRIGRKISLEEAKTALRLTREAGITSSLNFMHGFPWDKPETIRKTRHFIRQVAPLARNIVPAGILVPYPGTRIYEQFRDEYTLDDWWLKEEAPMSESMKLEPPLFQKVFFYYDPRRYDFFRYTREVTREIDRTARLIGRHNLLFYAQGIAPAPFHRPVRELLFLLMMVSKALYNLSPRLERALMRPFLLLAAKKEAVMRSRRVATQQP